MQKSTVAFLVASMLSLGAVASNERYAEPGKPQDKSQDAPSFRLSEGYFSLFTLFSSRAIPSSDTIRKTVPMPRIKEDTRRPR